VRQAPGARRQAPGALLKQCPVRLLVRPPGDGQAPGQLQEGQRLRAAGCSWGKCMVCGSFQSCGLRDALAQPHLWTGWEGRAEARRPGGLHHSKGGGQGKSSVC
jgi:hypothetical protein